MATLRHMLRSATINILKNSVKCQQKSHFHTSGARYLFSADILGLDNYERHRASNQDYVGQLKEKFRTRMEEYMQTSTQNTIFSDDLKTIVYIAESEQDVDTTIKMMRRFHHQQSQMSFSSFVFGPLVMRMLYKLKLPDLALQLFKDEDMSGFFDQMTSYVLLMDLLFQTERYQEVLEVRAMVEDKAVNSIKYPSDCITLAAAACTKMNTPESYEKLKELFREVMAAGSKLSLKAINFGAHLALQQNDAAGAYEILGMARDSRTGRRPVPLANMRAQCLVHLGRPEEAVQQLRELTLDQIPRGNKFSATEQKNATVLPETLEEVRKSVSDSEDESLKKAMEELEKAFQEDNYIIKINLEDFIFQTIRRPKQLQDGYRSRQRSALGGMTRQGGQREYLSRGLQAEEY